MKKCGIYKITSPINKIYIGQSKNIQQRFWGYMSNAGARCQWKLFESLKEYGWNKHKAEIIEECHVDLLKERERYWQDYYDCLGINELNCILTKIKNKKFVLSEETRKKYSLIRKGVKLSDELKDKLSKIKKR